MVSNPVLCHISIDKVGLGLDRTLRASMGFALLLLVTNYLSHILSLVDTIDEMHIGAPLLSYYAHIMLL